MYLFTYKSQPATKTLNAANSWKYKYPWIRGQLTIVLHSYKRNSIQLLKKEWGNSVCTEIDWYQIYHSVNKSKTQNLQWIQCFGYLLLHGKPNLVAQKDSSVSKCGQRSAGKARLLLITSSGVASVRLEAPLPRRWFIRHMPGRLMLATVWKLLAEISVLFHGASPLAMWGTSQLVTSGFWEGVSQ